MRKQSRNVVYLVEFCFGSYYNLIELKVSWKRNCWVSVDVLVLVGLFNKWLPFGLKESERARTSMEGMVLVSSMVAKQSPVTMATIPSIDSHRSSLLSSNSTFDSMCVRLFPSIHAFEPISLYQILFNVFNALRTICVRVQNKAQKVISFVLKVFFVVYKGISSPQSIFWLR